MFEPLPEILRTQRGKLNLSQARVAQLAGVGRAQYVNLEAGKANVTLGFLIKVARVLELTAVQVDDLYIHGTSPDLKALVRAREAVANASEALARLAGGSKGSGELDELSATLDELIERPKLAGGSGIAEAAEQLRSSGNADRSRTGRALREAAQSDRVQRTERPAAAAKSSPRKRARSSR
jgi:transcriptional regulator with XRE-family HTH domain